MTTQVLKGSKQEIAASIASMSGEVREAIVFIEEPKTTSNSTGISQASDIFAEMRPYMVDVANLDDSRAAIYTRGDGE